MHFLNICLGTNVFITLSRVTLLLQLGGMIVYETLQDGTFIPSSLFAIHTLFVISTYYVLNSISPSEMYPLRAFSESPDPRLQICTALIVLSLLVILFVFGGIAPFLNMQDKGSFRASLGMGGIPYTILLKFLIPSITAFSAFLFWTSPGPRTFQARSCFILTCLVTLLAGQASGGKSTGLMLLIPAFIVTLTYLKDLRFIVWALAFSAVFILANTFFFDIWKTPGQVVNYIFERIFLVPTEPAIVLTGRFLSGENFSWYSGTFLGMLSRQGLDFLGMEHSRLAIDYSARVTHEIYGSFPLVSEMVKEGHYNTHTSNFVEGLIGFGWLFPLYSILHGGLIFTFHRLFLKFQQKSPAIASTVLTYFVMVVLQWVNAGGITILIHILSLLGFATTVVLLSIVEEPSRITKLFRRSTVSTMDYEQRLS